MAEFPKKCGDDKSSIYIFSLKLRKKRFCETLFQLRMDMRKGQKQGRDKRTQEDYPTFVETQQM